MQIANEKRLNVASEVPVESVVGSQEIEQVQPNIDSPTTNLFKPWTEAEVLSHIETDWGSKSEVLGE
jgi:hypothetical protein